jgi:hypothetical protein
VSSPLIIDLLPAYARHFAGDGARPRGVEAYTRMVRNFAWWLDPDEGISLVMAGGERAVNCAELCALRALLNAPELEGVLSSEPNPEIGEGE